MSKFKEMPIMLKFITAHALACVLFLVAALVPGIPFYFNGKEMTFSEVWYSGIGVFTIYVSIAMPVCGVLILKRVSNARVIYLAVLCSVLIVPYIYWKNTEGIIFGVATACFIAAYMFGMPSARNYFASNKSFKSDALKRAA